MAGSTYSTNLKIELMTTGENSGTWGDVTNTNLGTAMEQAVVGYGNPDYASDANLTISITNSNASQAARALVLNVTSTFGSLTATRELVVPTIQKQYIVQNNTAGGQSITVKTSAGTGITVPNGRKAHLYVDGTNVIQMFDFVDINGGAIDGTTIGASSASTGAFTTLNASGATTLDGNVTLGNASGDTVTVTGTISSNLLFTDNTYDIGASGATRPRNLYLAGAATIGGNLSVGGTLTLTGGLTLNGNVTVGDSASDTLTINSTVTSNLIFTDNTYDIGASGATRPRNLFIAGNITAGGNQTLTGALTVDSTTDSSSTTTGSIQTDGGLGVAKALYVGSTANIAGAVTLSGGTANGVAYLNGSKVLTTGSVFGFNGTNVTLGTTSSTNKLLIDTAVSNAGTIQLPRGSFIGFSNAADNSNSEYVYANGGALEFGINGSTALNLSSAGNLDVIGTADTTLTVRSSAGAYSTTLKLQAAGGGGSAINATGASSDYLRLLIAGSEKARLDGTGFGVGASAPRVRFQVTPAANASEPSLGTVSAGSVFTSANTNYGLNLGVAAAGYSWMQAMRFDGTATAYDLMLQVNGGNVNIRSATNEGQTLKVGSAGGGDAVVGITAGAASTSYLWFGDTDANVGFISYAHATNEMNFRVSSSIRAMFDGSGRIGFGTQGTTGDRLVDMSFQGATLDAGSNGFGVVLNPTYPNTITSTIFNLYSGPNLTAGTTVANVYGHYLETINAAGSTVTNKWGIYQAGSGDNNYFAGSVNIGSSNLTSSTYRLQVYGSNIGMRILDGTNSLTMGQWDGSTNRIESSGRKLLITSYNTGIDMGYNGSGGAIFIDTNNDVTMNDSAIQYSAQLYVNGAIAARNGGVDGVYQNAFVAGYTSNYNERNIIQTAVSSAAAGSGFRFQVSNGAGSSGVTNAMDVVRSKVQTYVPIDVAGGSAGGSVVTHTVTNANVLYASGNSTGFTDAVILTSSGQATGANFYSMFSYRNSNVNVASWIRGDGTYGSATNTYGGTSDARLKTDIVDAGSQWEDVKAFRIRKYRMIDDPTNLVQLGVVSQELETTSPGLVEDTKLIGEEGATIKTVKYSILYMKAVKALQEAMERIEQLEARLAAANL